MPIIDENDGGTPQVYRMFMTGLATGETIAEGAITIVYPRGSVAQKFSVEWPMLANDAPALGGAALHSQAANQYRARQLEELSSNYYQQPVYIQWYAGGSVTPVQIVQDGWYIIERCNVNYQYTFFGIITIKLDVVFLYPGGVPPIRRVAQWWGGGSLSTTGYNGSVTPWTAFPNGITTIANSGFSLSRVGAEGAIPFTSGYYRSDYNVIPPVNPTWFRFGSSITNWYKGGCRIYDTINTGSNPVPVAGGTFVNANWLEVKGQHHLFQGDFVVTNGLLLFLFQINSATPITGYVWDTTLGTPTWQLAGTATINNNAGASLTSIALSLVRAGREDVFSIGLMQGATNVRLWLKLIRGAYFFGIGLQPLSENNTVGYAINWFPAHAPKIIWNSTKADDLSLALVTLPPTSDFGWAAAMNSTDHFITGILWQNPPGSKQPGASSQSLINIGESAVPLQNIIQNYWFFAFPFSASIANLQAEAESGTLGTGWSSVVDAGASGGNAAKCASGTVSGNADTFGTSWTPPAGGYDVWVRGRVTSNASGTLQMNVGYRRGGVDTFINFAPNTFPTTYGPTSWVRVGVGIIFDGATTLQFKAQTSATLTTDFFFDQGFLAPTTQATSGAAGIPVNFPQDLWQQAMWDVTRKMGVT